jgi:hypothetical protein
MDPITLSLLAASALSGLGESIWGGKSKRLDSLLDDLKKQMDGGASGEEKQYIRNTHAPAISRGISSRQARIAAAHSSRGTSYGSQLLSDIGSLPSVEEELAPLFAQADQEARNTARQAYYALSGQRDAMRNKAIHRGLSTLGQSLAYGATSMMPSGDSIYDDALGMVDPDTISAGAGYDPTKLGGGMPRFGMNYNPSKPELPYTYGVGSPLDESVLSLEPGMQDNLPWDDYYNWDWYLRNQMR